MEKLSFKDMVSSLVKRNPQEQQIFLNIPNMTLLESHTLPSVGRLVKERNDIVKQCLDALGMVVASTVPSLLEYLVIFNN
ncbi:hypothetical protein KY290_024905 [Solanum tuberosum]|uniref:Uncharacterized protein n=1 Tax=Solanum tuberosum TaxID=4113 RepID=A0ABQ7US07_SOLTU|nr:hypothetical protein KY284_023756 [Solanum tuberosum]KAH0754635.1 hypothetical protein KY290_024905 [Solanum tuberosum]